MRLGGESGPLLAPGNLEDSFLIEPLEYESLEMPPDGQLPEEVIADFIAWIKRGGD